MKPYFFSLVRNNLYLFYLGVKHSWDPNDSQFIFIEEKWKEFLYKIKPSNSMVVVEHRPGHYLTKSEAILKHGEVGLISFLANQEKIDVICLEPDRGLEIKELLNKFNKEEIAYYYFARTIVQYYRLTQKIPFEQYIKPFFERDKKVSKWNNFEFSISHMVEIHQKIFRTKPDISNPNFFNIISNPTMAESIINEVARDSGKYRDKKIINGVKKIWETKNIFIIYGFGHAKSHEKAFKQLS